MEDSMDFRETLELLKDSQWLYRDPVTEILVKGHLASFPSGWLEVLQDLNNEELNDLVVNYSVKDHWPVRLIHFVETCKRLNKLSHKKILEAPNLPDQFKLGLSIKKQHEIIHLAKLIHEKCSEAGVKFIVDLGAGLGYVSQLLNYMYGYRILAFDSNHMNIEAAIYRQCDFYPESSQDVTYFHKKITEDSKSYIEGMLCCDSKRDRNEEVCLIGLHSCADLSVDACKIFSKMSRAKLLIMVPCCYHKIEFDEKANAFKNFPLSQELSSIIEKNEYNIEEILNRPFLRLACQESADRWEKMSEDVHREHAFCVLARAAMELYAHQNGVHLKKRVRKATRKSQCLDFDTYLADFVLRYKFCRKNSSNDSITAPTALEEIKEIWEQNKQKLNAAEIYTGLQLLLQAPAESLVLNDRRAWLMEQGCESQIVTFSNSKISPRCYAIVSRKM